VHEGPDRPRAVAAGRCTGSVAHGWAPIAAHQVDLELAPGERRRFQFRLGYCENPKDQKFTSDGRLNMAPYTQAVAAFDSDSRVDAAFASLADAWADRLDAYQARLDDPRVERMVNTWNQYQCMITFLMSRSASGYESGIGRGMGYRDSNQDILGMVHLAPDRCRERLCDLAATQMSDGSCFHQYQPLTKKGNADIGGGFNDDPLWLVLAVGAYIRETGDTSILDEPVGYADDDPPGAGGATIGDHLELSLRYTESNLGPHGLPLIGHADWNDCLNLNCFSDTPGESFQTAGDVEGSDAESVMIAGLYAAACAEMADLCDHLGEADRAEELRDRRRSMADTIERSAWDGAWFRRAYDADGKPLGSKDCDEGQIFIEPQGWCVLGGVGVDNGKARAALDSVRQRLATDHGIVLQQPAYAAYDRAKGEITSYPPGYKENAGIFAHSNTWIQIAETILGDGDQAFAYFRSICPAFVEDHDLYRAEPYVYAQMIAGRDAPNHGEAKNSWLTGTAGWSFVAISQHILGVRPDYAGLRIDPCVPREWRSFSITRRFRGTRYEITVHNPDGVSRGVGAIEVDGTPIDGPVVPAASGSDTVRVDVRLAAAAMERSSA
jgi:cellobiose phosphorylase